MIRSPIKKKILLLLMGGSALCLTRTPGQYFKIIKAMSKEWKRINKDILRRNIRELYQSKLIDFKENTGGFIRMTLTEKGKQKILQYHLETMKISPQQWDKKWRIVIFDIPENKRKARDALRLKLRDLGFYQLQKSVFVCPYECRNEIDFIIEIFEIRKYVRFGILDSIDNELHLKHYFGL